MSVTGYAARINSFPMEWDIAGLLVLGWAAMTIGYVDNTLIDLAATIVISGTVLRAFARSRRESGGE